MASSLSKKDREYFEKFINEHKPYSEDDPEYYEFDGDSDPDRSLATLMKLCLEGKIK